MSRSAFFALPEACSKGNTAGSGESSKTRADVPATHARKAASGKQVGR